MKTIIKLSVVIFICSVFGSELFAQTDNDYLGLWRYRPKNLYLEIRRNGTVYLYTKSSNSYADEQGKWEINTYGRLEILFYNYTKIETFRIIDGQLYWAKKEMYFDRVEE